MRNSLIRKKWESFHLHLMLLPAILVTFVFVYLPAVQWGIAFFEYRIGQSLSESEFVGLKYFVEFFNRYGDAWPVIRNTVRMNISSLMISLVLALIISFYLQTIRTFSLRFFILICLLLPYFFSWTSVVKVVDVCLGYNDGLVNNFLSSAFPNYHRINFMGDPDFAQPIMICISVWKEIGFNILILSTAMEQIPQEIYDASEIDGASTMTKFKSITVPNIAPTIVILTVLEFGWMLSSDLDKYYLFTNPTNIVKMEVLDMYIYRYGLKLGRFSYAAAVSIVKNIVSIILVGIALLCSRAMNSIIDK